jgi:hypothetical protein
MSCPKHFVVPMLEDNPFITYTGIANYSKIRHVHVYLMLIPLVLIQTWTYKQKIYTKMRPLYTQGKILTMPHLRWPWPLTRFMCMTQSFMVFTFETKKLNSCYLKIHHAQRSNGIDKFGCTQTHTNAEQYVELKAWQKSSDYLARYSADNQILIFLSELWPVVFCLFVSFYAFSQQYFSHIGG